MEADLSKLGPLPPVPTGYGYMAWRASLLPNHADVKYRSFRWEMDSQIFPCLGEPEGCQRLMEEITQRSDFVPEATWLAFCFLDDAPEFCGTIQGLKGPYGIGGIQNVGILPEHRHRGVGYGLVLRAMHGFRQAGLRRASLEVTADNLAALRLYRRLGFHTTQTVYKSVEPAFTI